MNIPTFGTGQFAEVAALIGLLLLMVAMLILVVAVMFDNGYTERREKSSLVVARGGGVVAALGGVAVVLVVPIAVIATFFYTPPVVPVPASTATLTGADGRDSQLFEIVCDGRQGEVELRGNERAGTFASRAYRFRVNSGDVTEPAQFSVGLRWENKGWGSRLGGAALLDGERCLWRQQYSRRWHLAGRLP